MFTCYGLVKYSMLYCLQYVHIILTILAINYDYDMKLTCNTTYWLHYENLILNSGFIIQYLGVIKN